MATRKQNLIYWSTIVIGALAMWTAVGCASSPDGQGWPEVDAVAPGPPEAGDGEGRLVRGDDGLLYAVGDFDTTPRAGQMIFGTYGGQWPLEDVPRPALFAGEVLGEVDDGIVRVHGLYEFPDTDHDTLRVEIVDGRGEESMGKGLDVVRDVSDETPYGTVEFGLGSGEGVQTGDMYALIRPHARSGDVEEGQLTRRLSNICRVVDVGRDSSTCRLRRGHPAHSEASPAEKGDFAVFLEPTLAPERRQARVIVSEVDDEDVNEMIRERLESYFADYPRGNVRVEFFDQSGEGPPLEDWEGRGGPGAKQWADEEIDARDTEFHRWSRRLETDEPALLVGVNVEDGGLVINYTGLGGAVGPGMVAAPPVGGVEMGQPEAITEKTWQGLASVLKGTMLVYRGETAQALMHLHDALKQPGLSGPWRWHARDQYAMRWAALDYFEEALWLVHEDEAVARHREDSKARDNAIGTRVRLHDYIDQHEVAYQTARQYLKGQGDVEPRGQYLSAVAMLGEMAVQVGELERTRAAIDELHELCPEGCEGDLLGLLAGIYWAAMDDSPELQDELVDQIVAVGELDAPTSMASARMFQGWNQMRDDDMDWAMVAFREALRRFEEQDSKYGAARAKFYLAVALMERDESREAFTHATEALEYMTKIGDYMSMARIYERMAFLFVPVDSDGPPEPFMRAAPQFLRAGLQAQIATGDYGRASEAGFGYGHFLLRSGSFGDARTAFERASEHALRAARFDMVALSDLFLAMLAEHEGDMQTYQVKIERAQAMAEVADDPFVDDMIEGFLSPSSSPEEEDPTQLL